MPDARRALQQGRSPARAPARRPRPAQPHLLQQSQVEALRVQEVSQAPQAVGAAPAQVWDVPADGRAGEAGLGRAAPCSRASPAPGPKWAAPSPGSGCAPRTRSAGALTSS